MDGQWRTTVDARGERFLPGVDMVRVDVASRDEALAIARRCPATAWATVEVRECAPCNAN